MQITLEEAIGYVASDELIEVCSPKTSRCALGATDNELESSFLSADTLGVPVVYAQISNLMTLLHGNLTHYLAMSIYEIHHLLSSMQVTPNVIRLRKKCLDVNKRKTLSKRPKE